MGRFGRAPIGVGLVCLSLVWVTVGGSLLLWPPSGWFGPGPALLLAFSVSLVAIVAVYLRVTSTRATRVGGYLGTVAGFASLGSVSDLVANAGCVPGQWFFFVVVETVCPTPSDSVLVGVRAGVVAAIIMLLPLVYAGRRHEARSQPTQSVLAPSRGDSMDAG